MKKILPDRRKAKSKPPTASGIPVHCHFDEIVDASARKLWGEQPGSKNPQVHPAKQLDRFKIVVTGNGYRRSAVVSSLSGCVTKGNGMVQMARREGWSVPIERQHYKSRAEEIRDVAADNELAKLAKTDDDALRQMLGELEACEIQFTAISEEEFEQLRADLNVPEGEFPITAKLGESYDYVLIFTTNATEHAYLQNLFGLRPERSYKKTGVGLGRAIPLDRAIVALRKNRHSLDVQGGEHDHAPTPPARDRVCAKKPAGRIRASRRE
jgi:hypothetical protein